MPVEILGPLRVHAGGVEITIRSSRERALLSVLLLHANQTVSTSLLIDAIWADRPPPGARNQLQGCVSRLRRRLAPTGVQIQTDADGYRVTIAPDDLDLLQFRRLVDQARATTGHTDATTHYREALRLWRGPALFDTDSSTISAAVAALDEECLQVRQECIEAELAAGGAPRLIPELTELVGRHRHREAFYAALMLALYRTGRQADALATYRHARTLLHDELGIEPGPDLQRLHQAILNRDPELHQTTAGASHPPAPRPPTPRELPAGVAEFVGRADALKQLDNLVTGPTPGSPGRACLAVVSGTAGVGKTALAVHWAHQVADRFPDGQLFLNLRGFASATPLRPVDAIPRMLRSLGTAPDQIPADEAEAAARYRSQLAERRVLIVLDNVRSADQVRPLLPGAPGCFVLITSRNRLSGLVARDGARAVELDVFTKEEARALLTQVIGVEPVEAEPDATGALARACAHLALALQIAAADLAARPPVRMRIASYLADLTTGDPFTMLQADDDEESAVRAAFEQSYRATPEPAQRLFRRLGLVTSPDVTPLAAAALAATTVQEADRWLRQLASSHLVEEHAPARYTFHDLLRRYSRQLAEAQDGEDERAAAVERMVGSYLGIADDAARLLHPQMLRLPLPPAPAAPVARFTALADALVWLDEERANLVAAVTDAAQHGLGASAWLLADRLRGYFSHGQHLADWLTVADAAVAATEQDGDPQARAAAHFSRAHLCQSRGRHREALDHYDTAAELAANAGWLHCQAAAQSNLGMIHQDRGQLAQAAACHRRGLALNQARNDPGGQAVNLVNLGVVDVDRGRLLPAAEHLSRALDVNRQLGYQHGEAVAALNLGAAWLQLGGLDRAREQLGQALTGYRQTGDRSGEAATLQELALACLASGREAEALELARRALALAIETGDRRREADAHNRLGQVQHRAGQAALTCHREALTLARQVEARRTETVALIGLAAAQHRLGEPVLAADSAVTARELAHEIGYRVLEGQATTLLSEIQHTQRHDREARALAERALVIHHDTGHRLGEARTLVVLGHIRQATGGQAEARRAWQAAYDIFTDIGSPVPDELAGRLGGG